MPRIKYRELLNKLRQTTIFTYNFLKNRLGENYAKIFIYNLKKNDKIIELIKGVYSFKKSPYLLLKAIPYSYIGLGSAAFLHGIWEEVPNITILSPLVSTSVKAGDRIIAGRKVILRKISIKMYFGYEYLYNDELNEWIRVSDIEKTLIDVIYFNYPFKDEIIDRALDYIDDDKLYRYLKVLEDRNIRGWIKISRKFTQIMGNNFSLSS